MFEEIHVNARLSGLGQVPPIGQDAIQKVVLASVGLVAASVMFYLVFGRSKPSAQTESKPTGSA